MLELKLEIPKFTNLVVQVNVVLPPTLRKKCYELSNRLNYKTIEFFLEDALLYSYISIAKGVLEKTENEDIDFEQLRKEVFKEANTYKADTVTLEIDIPQTFRKHFIALEKQLPFKNGKERKIGIGNVYQLERISTCLIAVLVETNCFWKTHFPKRTFTIQAENREYGSTQPLPKKDWYEQQYIKK